MPASLLCVISCHIWLVAKAPNRPLVDVSESAIQDHHFGLMAKDLTTFLSQLSTFVSDSPKSLSVKGPSGSLHMIGSKIDFLWREHRHSDLPPVLGVESISVLTFSVSNQCYNNCSGVSWKQLVMVMHPNSPWLLCSCLLQKRIIARAVFCQNRTVFTSLSGTFLVPAARWRRPTLWWHSSYCRSHSMCLSVEPILFLFWHSRAVSSVSWICLPDLFIDINTVYRSVQEYQLCAFGVLT